MKVHIKVSMIDSRCDTDSKAELSLAAIVEASSRNSRTKVRDVCCHAGLCEWPSRCRVALPMASPAPSACLLDGFIFLQRILRPSPSIADRDFRSLSRFPAFSNAA